MTTMTKDGDLGQEERNIITASSDGTFFLGIPLVSSMESGDVSGIKMEEDEDLDEMEKADDDDVDVSVSQMLSVVNAGGNLIRTNHTTLQSLLSTPISGSQVFAQSDGIQVITLPTASELMGLSGDMTERLVHMVPANGDLSSLGTKYIGLITISNSGVLPHGKGEISGFSSLEMVQASDTSDLNSAAADSMAAILMPPPPAPLDLPSNCPHWATRLKKCEKIGDSYRGYVENEIDLDLILTLHKQTTNSFWGTRQSPSPAKASTRLMWKSQYVPFDGIPFVNAGSRAVVMECQYGPRRKGTLGKRGAASNTSNEFKQTCPARIYIKKVRKFPSYAVNLNMDKKSVRLAMDKAFHELREHGLDSWGEERYYVQLPTEKAHDYHEEGINPKADTSAASVLEEASLELQHQHLQLHERIIDARIHPAVLEKIRQLVASGETKLYTIRRQLRRFVVRDMFQGSGQVPERHDLTMFPTVNDLKNHIHQALKDIESGVLPYSPQVVNLEVIQGSDGSNSEEKDSCRDDKSELSSIWSSAGVPSSSASMSRDGKSELSSIWSSAGVPSSSASMSRDGKSELSSIWSGASIPSSSAPMPETVTVTLTQNPGDDGHHIISRIETHLSDGTTQVSTTLTPETAQLLSRLHPGLFPAGSLLQLESHIQSPESKHLTDHVDELDVTQDASSIENSALDLDTSVDEAVHVIGGMDSSHLSSMVDLHTAHNISAMIDSETATSMLVNSDSSHSISCIHLDHSSAQNISGLINSDSANLASIVTSDARHHITSLIIPASSLSVLSAADHATLSEMVAHQETMALVSGDSVHAMDLVSGDGETNNLNLVGDEVCEQMIHKSSMLEDQEDGNDKLTDAKLALHITSDQKMGMTRLENKVSDL